MARQINQAGINLVKQFEGLRTKAYLCPAGIWTIGYGHTGPDVKQGLQISEDQAEQLLSDDLAGSGVKVSQLVRVPLNDDQFAALTSFVFNAGAGSLASSTLLRRLNGGDYDCVPSELCKWVKATDPATGKKVSLPGLVKRRAAEGELWLTSSDPFVNSSAMPQKVEADNHRNSYLVSARNGLRVRAGAGVAFDVIKELALDTRVYVIKEKDGWAAVDVEGDGAIDGWVAMDFLRPA